MGLSVVLVFWRDRMWDHPRPERQPSPAPVPRKAWNPIRDQRLRMR